VLVGRAEEQRQIDLALASARSGRSAVLAIAGDVGIGKTALIDYAAERADRMRLLRARGIESEAQIPFGSLLELLRPALDMLDQIPAPQAQALEAALALRPGHAAERFAVSAATLSLLAAYAEVGPVAVLIDDAHWLDGSSAQALLFAFRRLLADPIAVLLAVREEEPSLLDGADLPTLRIGGLSSDDAIELLPSLPASVVRRLRDETAGNPLALLELGAEPQDLALAPEGVPLLLPAQLARAFLRRAAQLDDTARRALTLASTSDSGELAVLGRAAERLGIDLSSLQQAESAGLVNISAGRLEFRHPLVRSALYAAAPADERRGAHRALAAVLPDRDVDRRAWHLAAAAVGADEAASIALEQAGVRARSRSAYATAAAAFERAGWLTFESERRARLLLDAADALWNAGFGDRARAVLDGARELTEDHATLLDADELAGHIATRRGPVMRGHGILTAAAERADPERAVEILAEAVSACFYAGNPAEMLAVAQRARVRLPENASVRARFLVAVASGMAGIFGGDAAAGAGSIKEAIALAESNARLREDPKLLPWLAIAPMFLRQAGSGRALLEHALTIARERALLGVLPLMLNLVARDQATSDQWKLAELSYREAIALARENDQRTDLVYSLSGLAWLLAREGEDPECRACAAEALALGHELGTHLHEVWTTAALGELELALGAPAAAAEHFEHQRVVLAELGITDADLSPIPDLVEAYIRLGREPEANRLAVEFTASAVAKGQPWSLARAFRCQGMLADDGEVAETFEQALAHHERTVDVFETARSRLVYGERLRRARNRVTAREQLRVALEVFDRLGALPWAERARAELAATGETLRRRDPTTIDELTPQELQIALLLASGKTTREAAAALFLSPKTIEYHLRRVYLKLGIHSRTELAEALAMHTASSAAAAAVTAF
jgi:DNA-binding CsgD family transcriptional regulator/tetratricopeptide (TPR) repeat protein